MHKLILAIASVFFVSFSAISAHAGAIEECSGRAKIAASKASIAALRAHPKNAPEQHDHGPSYAAAYAELASADFEEIDVSKTIEDGWSTVSYREEEERKNYLLRNIRAARVALHNAIVAKYCTNDPADCYGVLDIDVNSNIVHNETTGRMVDLSVCRSKGLAGSSLDNLNLRGVNLSGANLRGSDFRRSNLAQANMQGANLGGADLSRANLTQANLRGADLQGASLIRASIEQAKLTGANLKGAVLEKASLVGANLRGSVLDEADLRGAVFTNAILAGVSLKGAILQGAKFIGTRVTLAQLSVANWAGVIVEAAHAKGLKDLNDQWDAIVGDQ